MYSLQKESGENHEQTIQKGKPRNHTKTETKTGEKHNMEHLKRTLT